jgi:hypothetical protein
LKKAALLQPLNKKFALRQRKLRLKVLNYIPEKQILLIVGPLIESQFRASSLLV